MRKCQSMCMHLSELLAKSCFIFVSCVFIFAFCFIKLQKHTLMQQLFA